jgi:hypothetical protein
MKLTNKEKLLHNVAAKFIIGENIDFELEGNELEIKTLHELLVISKNLRQALNESNPDLSQIELLLKSKKDITKRFEDVSGITWRL